MEIRSKRLRCHLQISRSEQCVKDARHCHRLEALGHAQICPPTPPAHGCYQMAQFKQTPRHVAQFPCATHAPFDLVAVRLVQMPLAVVEAAGGRAGNGLAAQQLGRLDQRNWRGDRVGDVIANAIYGKARSSISRFPAEMCECNRRAGAHGSLTSGAEGRCISEHTITEVFQAHTLVRCMLVQSN